MTTHFQDSRVLPFSDHKLFDLVASVEQYPEFLPWCLAARLQKRTSTLLIADLVVGYKAFRETYTSRVTLEPPKKISVVLEEGPLTFLKTEWLFEALPSSHCRVSLDLAFAFRSKVKQVVMKALFEDAAQKMLHAFETRAHTLYSTLSK